MSWRNAWLWAAPTLLMLLGLIVGWRILYVRSHLAASDEADSNGESPDP